MRHPFHRHLYRPLPTFAPLVMCIVVFATLPSQFSVMADEASAQPSNGIEEKNDGESLKISDEQAEFFQTKVLPLLESRCFECHGDQDDVEAELRLTSRKAMLTGGESGAAIVPSDPDSSLIIQAMRYEGFQMPPRSKMPDAEIDIFVKWIKDGAPWPAEMESKTAVAVKTQFPMDERIASHWAWKKIQRPDVPTTKNSSWPISDVDRFLLVALENAGISPAGDADRRVLLRRLYFDLIGLPPTVEQQDRFFQDPAETSMAMEKVVDELLASPQFGERWARHWLDLMRYAETLGHEFDYPLPHAWRYRDYVIRAFNNDVPYDQFVREHIAGDLLTQPRRHPQAGFNESIIATGFWYLCEDKHAPVDVKAEEASRIDNQIDVFGKTFLGLTIACARCHDHKFDAITAEDYYALSGFLQSSRRRVEWIDSHGETDKLIAALQTHRVAAEKQLYTGLEEFRKAEQASLITDASGLKPSIEESPASSADERDVDKDKTTRLAQILADPQTKDLSHPLSLWATIKQKADNQTLSEVVESWTAIRDLARQKNEELIAKRDPSKTQILADLRSGLPKDWLTYGAAFSTVNNDVDRKNAVRMTWTEASKRPDTSSTADRRNAVPMTWTESGCRPDTGGSVSSAVLSPKLRGTLHSPEFVLTQPEIHILAAGRGTRVRLIIDGYVMHEFSELLFGGMRPPIDTEGEFRWIRIAGDTHRYRGHRCHLEFLDDGDGWFAVREVRLVTPSEESHKTASEIAATNRAIDLKNATTTESVMEAWAKASQYDPEWASLVMQLQLLAPEQQTALTTACESWKSEAGKSQPGDPVLAMCDGTGEDEYVFIRGNHNNRGPTASRHLLTALDRGEPLKNASGSGRLELAERVLAESNPFPARVMVNRVWQHLFGRGLVPTSDNFGVLGEAPTHPELLDLLADDFRNDGWSVKRLIRRLVLSHAYRLSSERQPLADEKDPSNKLLHRFSVRRLEGEALRDAMLTVSGRLDPVQFGPPVPVYLSTFMQGRGRPGQSGPLDGAGRRSIYQGVNRNFLNPFMLAFDTPQPATAIGRRSVSNVPAQALMLLNNEFVHEQARVWAARLIREVPDGGPAILDRAYRQALSRMPSDEERAALIEFAQAVAESKSLPVEQSLRHEAVISEVCHVILNQKEFAFLQ